MSRKQTPNDLFQQAFQTTLLQDGFHRKLKSFYYQLDEENKWLKTISMNTYSSGRLFRVCLNVYPYTQPMLQNIRPNLDYSHDILLMRIHADPDFQPLTDGFFTLEAFTPTEKSMQHVFDVYVSYFRSQFIACQTLEEVLVYQKKLELIDSSGAWNELYRMYGYLLCGNQQKAILSAYAYRNQLNDHKISFEQELAAQQVNPRLSPHEAARYQNSIDTLNDNIREIKHTIEALEYGDATPFTQEARLRMEASQAHYKVLFGR